MTLQNIQAGVIGGQYGYTTTQVLDASGEKIAGVSYVTKSATIAKVHIRTGTVTTSQNLKVSLQGINSNGDPDGTILNSGQAYGIITNPQSNIFYPVELQSATSVTAGQQISVVVEFESTAGNLQITIQTLGLTLVNYADFYDPGTSSWTKNSSYQLACLLEYSDGNYEISSFKVYAYTNVTYNSGSSPNEYGNYFSYPFPTKCIGASLYVDLDGNGTVYLYDSSDNVLASANLVSTQRRTNSSAIAIVYFSDAVTLSANQYYKLTLKATTTTSLTFYYMFVDDTAKWSVIAPEIMYSISRTGSGSWTENTLRRYMIVPILSAFDDGSGGGGETIKGNPTSLLGGYLNH